MKKPGRDLLKSLGSVNADHLNWRDMWAMVSIKAGRLITT